MAVLHTFEEIEKAFIAFSSAGPVVAAQVLEDARVASSKSKAPVMTTYYCIAVVEWWKRKPAPPRKKEKGEQSEWTGERKDKASYKEIKL